jgi:glucose/mannose transport system substrate-binding protein
MALWHPEEVHPYDESALGSAPAALHSRFQSIVRDHTPVLRRVLRRVGVPEAEVDDALQDTFLVLYTKQEEMNPTAERYYLVATALRVAANRRRGGRRRGLAYARYLNDTMTDAYEGDLDELGDREKADQLVIDALGNLPRDLRDVLVMVELDELSVAAIASQLGLPVGTAASRLRRARRAFEERLKEGGPAREDGDDAAVVFHWWTTPEERAALDAILHMHHRERPRTRVIGVHGGGVVSAKNQLNTRMLWNQPPDLFQASAGPDLLDWVRIRDRRGARLRPLDGAFSSGAWSAAFPRELLDATSFEGSVYGVPLNIHRTNNLLYNRRLLAEHGLRVPSSVEGFLEAATILKNRGIPALALGAAQAWPATVLAFENLMISIAGPRYYTDFFSGLRSPSDPELRETLETLKKVLSFANEDALSLTWDQAAERMMAGGAAMNIMGDWVRALLNARGFRCTEASDDGPLDLPAAEDFGQVPTFGTEGTFVFSSDVFAIPADARSPGEAAELLRTFGSSAGQVAFNLNKGSIPARLDFDASAFDRPARKTMLAFRTEVRVPTLTSLAPRIFVLTLNAAMGAFVANRDVEELLRVIKTNYHQLVV